MEAHENEEDNYEEEEEEEGQAVRVNKGTNRRAEM